MVLCCMNLINWHSDSFPVLRKNFDTPPYSQQIELSSQAQLRCHPPTGNPAARVIHWLKDGAVIDNSNFIQSSDGHLIIVQARMQDAGNYTCVASNDVLTRQSPSATITIYGKPSKNYLFCWILFSSLNLNWNSVKFWHHFLWMRQFSCFV